MTRDYDTMTLTLLHHESVTRASHVCNTSTTMQSSMDAEAHAEHVTRCIHYAWTMQYNTDLAGILRFFCQTAEI